MDHNEHMMYTNLPNLIIGFHGCERNVRDEIVNGKSDLKTSNNSYDWLGNGMYFWEQNLERAWQWARSSSKIKEPAVLGAVMDLGNCLNLLDSRCIDILRSQYDVFVEESKIFGNKIPQNRNVGSNKDLLLRYLDCAIIQHLHRFRKDNDLPQFDSVRGMFVEGGEIYKGSGFMDKSHIQICVRNPNCIKGFFIPRKIDENWRIP